jgi:hypothetical protein
MKKLKKKQHLCVPLHQSATIIAQWWHPVASTKALDLLHWGMHAVLYRRTAAAIKRASKVGVFGDYCLFACCPDGRWGNME